MGQLPHAEEILGPRRRQPHEHIGFVEDLAQREGVELLGAELQRGCGAPWGTAPHEAAGVQPTRGGYINAVQVYPYMVGALYQVYTAPGQVTDIALQEGEQAGKNLRWTICDLRLTIGGGMPVKHQKSKVGVDF